MVRLLLCTACHFFQCKFIKIIRRRKNLVTIKKSYLIFYISGLFGVLFIENDLAVEDWNVSSWMIGIDHQLDLYSTHLINISNQIKLHCSKYPFCKTISMPPLQKKMLHTTRNTLNFMGQLLFKKARTYFWGFIEFGVE